MARRSKKNPLYYNLKGLRNERFEHRSLKRYKKKFPRERRISKWFPWADIQVIGMDLYEGDTNSEGLVPRMKEYYEVKVLLRRQWKYGKVKYPQTADLDAVELKWAAAFFSKFLTWQTQGLHGFVCSEERYEEIKDFLRKQHIWQFRKGFAPEVEALMFSPFDQVYNDFDNMKEGDIMVGLAPTGGLESQLTPQMMLHELTEFILGIASRKGKYDREDCLLGFGRIMPKFKNKRLYENMMSSYISRRETGHLLLELYWKNGRLFTPDDFLTYNEVLPIFEDRLNAAEVKLKDRLSREEKPYHKYLLEELKTPPPKGESFTERWQRIRLLAWEAHLRSLLNYDLPLEWDNGIESPTESEKIQMVERINEFVLEYTEQLLEIDKPIFMRL